MDIHLSFCNWKSLSLVQVVAVLCCARLQLISCLACSCKITLECSYILWIGCNAWTFGKLPFTIFSKGNDQEKSTAKKCSRQTCLIKSGDPTCSCFICQKDSHLSCMNFFRRSPKTSNLWCSICADFPAVIRKLYASIGTLTAAQNSMQKEQIKMKKSHDALLKENAVLRSELEILKSICSSETDAVIT